MRRPTAVIIVLLFVACGHAPTRPSDVRVVEEPPSIGCESIGHVEGRAATGPLSFGEARAFAERELRDAGARRGATHVVTTETEEPGLTTVVLRGQALRCPEQ